MWLRRSFILLDNTHRPHKLYRYSYVPDPRKFAPIERTAAAELFPQVVPPPTKYVPDTDTFLERCDIEASKPTADFKSVFQSWNELMTMSVLQMKLNGIPRATRNAISMAVHRFKKGVPPEEFDRKTEAQYWRQFKNKDGMRRIIPELPEKYRPHQHGIDSPPIPEYDKINEMPEWAKNEEARLASRMKTSL